MNNCLLCGQQFVPAVSLLGVFSWKKARTQHICTNCMAKFQRLASPRCPTCAGELSQNGVCSDCQTWQRIYGVKLLQHHAIFRYNDAFHDLMVNYKRYGDYVLKAVLQELCYHELQLVAADYYVPVPTSPAHFDKRQFDTISAIYGDLVPLTKILIKKSDSGAQGEKNRRERLITPQSFGVKNKIHNLNRKKLLLLDDIYTTGRTLYHARDALVAEFPTAIVESFSICR
ncbi:double zinc ribbon domain-containing protein [Lactobacillus sp. ESL0731]|uniref:ComF family protein n=1 Tax=unclassified Lactobacillus TaxID=2620435 RepID=UPI0023F6A233|nr:MULTISPECIES: double zinc ribbon domain-containing protein [unclassified Lactobacillus]WEV51751.1 double zinc ribbon domain-containing protein [Lactobacillus sp. ESL0700]WEV62880.1 double zinc ribbon domain-containing protein [Lactobacillus sp. ESL0731]